MPEDIFDAQPVLDTLKDFQRKTVDYVFKELYDRNKSRFLVADEMGLGKTLVAKGLIAKVVEYLQKKGEERIDIIYICSNHDIAEQNLGRLNITEAGINHSSRLTLLPQTAVDLESSPINFISFTPGTSFDLRSKGGKAEERALIYRLLRDGIASTPKRLSEIMRKDISTNSWEYWCGEVYKKRLSPTLHEAFIKEAIADGVPERISNCAPGQTKERNDLIGHIRGLLARSCLKALKPDLIILDEFQRFRDLLKPEEEMGQLAKHLFGITNTKTILLSATPYKMYTMRHDQESDSQDDHYKDFLNTTKFLLNNDKVAKDLRGRLDEFRKSVYSIPQDGLEPAIEKKNTVQEVLRGIMVRTERLSTSLDHNGMICSPEVSSTLKGGDLKQFKMLDTAARDINTYDMVEFWKSVPYPINLMDRKYKFKRDLEKAVENGDLEKNTKRAIAENADALLNWGAIRKYEEIDPGNAKLRTLFFNTIDKNAWKLLWIPPAKPYYTYDGSPFFSEELRKYSKSLVFSAWKAVPKTIAQLCSYAAEQRAVAHAGVAGKDYSGTASRPIEFKTEKEKLNGLHWLLLMYPSMTLAKEIDPLKISAQLAVRGDIPSYEAVLSKAKEIVGEKLRYALPRSLPDRYHNEPGESHNWYVAALAMLDKRFYPSELDYWRHIEDTDDEQCVWENMLGDGEAEASGFYEHAARLWDYAYGDKVPPGHPPDNLVDMLAKIAIASPATTALRSLLRFGEKDMKSDTTVKAQAAAAKVAIGMRSMLNNRESVSTIRACEGEESAEGYRYLNQVLSYCSSGNLQAVMDEYAYALKFHLGLMNADFGRLVTEIGEEMSAAASISTVPLYFQELIADKGVLKFYEKDRSLRCRFALRFDNDQTEDGVEETRRDHIRRSFNSPFRPFVLATTAIGQEGLDFHLYCHNIYHWNLPTNPVDLEQREGRIHRFMGHVIRKNIARAFPIMSVVEGESIWDKLFTEACKLRKDGQSEIWPYWIFDAKDSEKINRFVPALPLSRDLDHFGRLKSTLAVYRMVFGQPRQEDLADYLAKYIADDSKVDLSQLCIDLEPK